MGTLGQGDDTLHVAIKDRCRQDCVAIAVHCNCMDATTHTIGIEVCTLEHRRKHGATVHKAANHLCTAAGGPSLVRVGVPRVAADGARARREGGVAAGAL